MNKIETIIKDNRVNYETLVQTHERLYGKNSCFLASEDYHGLYHDDYCKFVYYSNITGESFKDEWTTAFACPHFDTFKPELTFEDAKKQGLIDIDIYNKQWSETHKDFKFDTYATPGVFNSRFPYIEVYRGRKNKGRKGYLVLSVYDAYRNHIAVIFDKKNNEFFKVKYEYIRDDKETLKEVENAINKLIGFENTITHRMRAINPVQIYDNLVYKGDYWTFIEPLKLMANEWLDRERYMPNAKFMTWLRDHFEGKTDEELIKIGIRINKKNSIF